MKCIAFRKYVYLKECMIVLNIRYIFPANKAHWRFSFLGKVLSFESCGTPYVAAFCNRNWRLRGRGCEDVAVSARRRQRAAAGPKFSLPSRSRL